MNHTWVWKYVCRYVFPVIVGWSPGPTSARQAGYTELHPSADRAGIVMLIYTCACTCVNIHRVGEKVWK